MKLTAEHKKRLLIQAADIRTKTAELVYHGNGGHIGGDLSEIDILTVLYDYMKHDPKNPDWDERDYFILSKGHAAEAYYVLLHEYGYIDKSDLDAFGSFQAKLGGHPTKKIKGVEANTGSLGHGLGLATGMALALKMSKKNNRGQPTTFQDCKIACPLHEKCELQLLRNPIISTLRCYSLPYAEVLYRPPTFFFHFICKSFYMCGRCTAAYYKIIRKN